MGLTNTLTYYSDVQARGLLPKWVQWALTQQPALFNRAFRRLFAQVGPSPEHLRMSPLHPAIKLADPATCKHVTANSVPALVRWHPSICRFVALQEINAASAAPGGDPLSAWALERFWRPAAGGVAAPPPEPLPVLGASAGGSSRYLTDFQVHHAVCDGQLHCGCEDGNLLLCSGYPATHVDRLSWAWPTVGDRQAGCIAAGVCCGLCFLMHCDAWW
jgi:hypothetical protein